MSEEQQQSLIGHSYEAITIPARLNTLPRVPDNQATIPWDRAVQIRLAQEISQDDIYAPPPAALLVEPHHVGYKDCYGPITPSDGVTHIHRLTPSVAQPTNPLNIIVPTQPGGTTTATVNGPLFLDIPFGGMGRTTENTIVPPGMRPNTGRDFNDAGYNPVVPGTSIADICRDFAVRFINNPQSIFIFRTECCAGRTRVTIELEIQRFTYAGYNPAIPGTTMTYDRRDLALWFINNPQSDFIANRMESSACRCRVVIELELVDTT